MAQIRQVQFFWPLEKIPGTAPCATDGTRRGVHALHVQNFPEIFYNLSRGKKIIHSPFKNRVLKGTVGHIAEGNAELTQYLAGGK
jgi:hypothetical protein